MTHLTFSIETKKSIDETKKFINDRLLSRPEAKMLLSDYRWDANVMHVSGSLGQGSLTVFDGRIEIDIELSQFGAMAKGQIEKTLTKELGIRD